MVEGAKSQCQVLAKMCSAMLAFRKENKNNSRLVVIIKNDTNENVDLLLKPIVKMLNDTNQYLWVVHPQRIQ